MTAQIRYCCQVHWPAAGLTPMTEVGDLPLDATATPDTHAMTAGSDLDSVTLNPDPVTTAIGVVATRTLIEVDPDLSIATSHMTEVLVPTTAAMTHLTTDLHPIETLPKMTADCDTDSESNTTDQTEDLHPLHGHHLGNTRTKDTSKSQLMTHPWSTTAPMTTKATQMMI